MTRTKPNSPERAALADSVIKGMREGLSCYKACEATGLNMSTFLSWVAVDDKLADTYARAREDLMERMASDLLDISDSDVEYMADGRKDWAAIQKHKLQVDTRKWLLSKLAPKKYGDKLEVSGDPDNPLAFTEIQRTVING
jgi:hypothetical protein